MAGPSVQIDAARTQRGLVPAGAAQLRVLARDPVLEFWASLIFHTVQDAKRTRNGLPTDAALLARWWIARHRPKPQDREEWERSFGCACRWLELDADEMRARLLAEIDQAWQAAWLKWVRPVLAERQALVLTWATERFERARPVAVDCQLLLPWPADESDPDYEAVVGVEHGDPTGWERKLRTAA